MFTGVSWREYLTIIALIFIAYYAALGLWLYTKKLRLPLSNKSSVKHAKGSAPRQPSMDTSFKSELITSEAQQEVDQLLKILKGVIARAFKRKYNRKKLLKSISWVLKKYSYLKDTSLKASIHETIIKECEKYGPVGLRDEELMGLWSTEVQSTI